MGVLWHGPLGNGATTIDALEGQARAAVAETELGGIQAATPRAPLARGATLTGERNDLHREGMGSAQGVSDYVRDVDGIARVRWADEPAAGGIPLLAEMLMLLALAFLIGIGAAWLLWGRPKRETYL